MRTLHQIFDHKVFSDFVKMLVWSAALILILFYMGLKSQSQFFMQIVLILIPPIIFMSPWLALLKNPYHYNVKNFLNQHFNRLDLIKFHFFSAFFRGGLIVLTYFILGGLFYFVYKLNVSNVETYSSIGVGFRIGNSYFSYSTLYFMLITFSFFLICPQKRPAEERPKVNDKRTFVEKALASDSYSLFFSSVIALALILELIPLLLALALLIPLLVYTAVSNILKFYRIKESGYSALLSPLLAVLMTIPSAILIQAMRSEAQRPDTTPGDKVSIISHLSWLAPKLSERDKLRLLQNVNDEMYFKALNVFGSEIELDSLLKFSSTKSRAEDFLWFYRNRQLSEDSTRKLINHMSALSSDLTLGFELAEKSRAVLSQGTVSKEYVQKLVDSSDSYKQFAATCLAEANLNKTELQSFYEVNFERLNQIVKEDKNVRRFISRKRQQSEGE